MDELSKIREDIHYLSGTTLTRRYGTEGELQASEYIRTRLIEMGLTPRVDPFYCPRSSFFVFALYWFEFLFVVLVSVLFPFLGFLYGLSVLVFYFLEVFGIYNISRWLEEFQSQNVYAEVSNQEWYCEPRWRIVFHANYDSGTTHIFHSMWFLKYLPSIHDVVVMSMCLILGVCVRDSVYEITPWQDGVSLSIRSVFGGILVLLSVIGAIGALEEEDTRGANFNASGVACLLRLAEHFKSVSPPESVELGFLLTGAHQSWMSGLRYFLSQCNFNKKNTLFVHIECVGSGKLHISTRERLVFPLTLERKWNSVVEEVCKGECIDRVRNLVYPTASFIILAKGYNSMTLIGLDEDGFPRGKNQVSDTTVSIDEKNIQHAKNVIVQLVNYIAEYNEKNR